MKGNLIILYSLRLLNLFQSFTTGSPLCWDISPSGPSRQKHQQTNNTVGTIYLTFNVKSYIWKICRDLKYSWFCVFKFYFRFLGFGSIKGLKYNLSYRLELS